MQKLYSGEEVKSREVHSAKVLSVVIGVKVKINNSLADTSIRGCACLCFCITLNPVVADSLH